MNQNAGLHIRLYDLDDYEHWYQDSANENHFYLMTGKDENQCFYMHVEIKEKNAYTIEGVHVADVDSDDAWEVNNRRMPFVLGDKKFDMEFMVRPMETA